MKISQNENFSTENVVVHIPDIERPSRFINIVTDKDRDKFIKKCEAIIRGSEEYRSWREYLKEYKDMTKCAFLPNLPIGNRRRKISIELHHEPFTLYDLVSIIMDKNIKEGEQLNYFLIAEEVMKLHYTDKVGYIPLSKTVHKLEQLGRIFIPLQIVDGKFVDFVKEYEAFIPDHMMETLYKKFKMSKAIANGEIEMSTSILGKKLIYIEQEGVTVPYILEDDKDHF